MSGELPKLLATCRSQQELKSVSDAYAREAQGKATILDNILLDRKRKQAGVPIPARASSKPPVTKSNISAALASLNHSRDILHNDQTERAPIRRYPLQPIEKPPLFKPTAASGPTVATSSLGNGSQHGAAATSTIGVHGQTKGRSVEAPSARSGGRGNSRVSPDFNQSDGERRRRHRRRRRRRIKREDVVGGGSSDAPSADGGIDSVGRERRRIATPSPSPPPLKRNRRKPAHDGFPDYSDSEEAFNTATAPKETAQWRESYGSNPGPAAAAGATTASETPADRPTPVPLGTTGAAGDKSAQQQLPLLPPPPAKTHFIDYGKGERESKRAALVVAFRRQPSVDKDEQEEEEDDDEYESEDDEEEEQDDDAEYSAEESKVERTRLAIARKSAVGPRERAATQPSRRTAHDEVDKARSQVPAAVHRRQEFTDGHIAPRPAKIAPAKTPPPQENEEGEEDEEEDEEKEDEEEAEEEEEEDEERKPQKKVFAISSQKRASVDETSAAAQRTSILASQPRSGDIQSSDVLLTSTMTPKAGGSREGLPTVALKSTVASSKAVVAAAVATKAAETNAETKREARARDAAVRAEAAAHKDASAPLPVVGPGKLPPIKQAQRGDVSARKSLPDVEEATRSRDGGRDGFASSGHRTKSPHANVAAGDCDDSDDDAHQPSDSDAAAVTALAKRLSRLSRSRSQSPEEAKTTGPAARNHNGTFGATGSLPELGSKKTRFQEGSTPPQQQQSHNKGGGGSTRRKKKRDMEAYVRALEHIVDSSLQYIIASTGEKLGIEQPLTVTKAKQKAEKASRASNKLRPSVVKKFLNGKYSKRVDAFLAEVD